MTDLKAEIKEEDFQRQVIDLAHIFNWRVAHFRPAMTKHGWRTAVAGDGAGFPDCVFVKPPHLIYAELKSETGQLSAEQYFWLQELVKCGQEVYLWKPSDFQEIASILRE